MKPIVEVAFMQKKLFLRGTIWRLCWVWSYVFLATGCWGDGKQTHVATPVVPVQVLRDIETRLIPNYRQGPARFDSLTGYFRDANPKLFAHIEAKVTAYRSGARQRGATYITGASGVGKSFVIGKLGLPPEDTSEAIKLSQCIQGRTADLQALESTLCFNQLPYAPDVTIEGLLASHGAEDKAFVLIDDLDEIHEASAYQLLRSLETYVRKPASTFQHLIVLGRPEAFWPWLADPGRRVTAHVSDPPFVLVGPDYQTYGDIAYRCENYFNWKFSQPVPPGLVYEVQAQLARYPFLRYTIRPLSAGNVVLKEAVARLQAQTAIPNTATQVREGLLVDLLERNAQSHQRPTIEDDRYMTLLERAAVFPLAEKRVLDERGFFTVYEDDTVTLSDRHGTIHRLGLRSLLNRSGLVFLDPSSFPKTRYRFEPFWLHIHLVERWNQRQHPD